MKLLQCRNKKQSTSKVEHIKYRHYSKKTQKYCIVRILQNPQKKNHSYWHKFKTYVLDPTWQTLITRVSWTRSPSVSAQRNECFLSAAFTWRENVNMEVTDSAFNSISQVSNLHLVQSFKPLRSLSDSPVFFRFFFFFCLAGIKPHWASLPLSCDFVKAIDFQLRPAPSLKPQKAYSSDSIFSLMRIL